MRNGSSSSVRAANRLRTLDFRLRMLDFLESMGGESEERRLRMLDFLESMGGEGSEERRLRMLDFLASIGGVDVFESMGGPESVVLGFRARMLLFRRSIGVGGGSSTVAVEMLMRRRTNARAIGQELYKITLFL